MKISTKFRAIAATHIGGMLIIFSANALAAEKLE